MKLPDINYVELLILASLITTLSFCIPTNFVD